MARGLWLAGGLALAAAALLAGNALRSLLEPDARITAPVNTRCDLHQGPCRTALPRGGEVILSILPRDIPVMQPLDIRVQIRGLEASSARVEFVGVNMDMGLTRAPLSAQGGAKFTGSGMLPVCTRSRMVWDARVMVETPRGLVVAPFRFETLRP